MKRVAAVAAEEAKSPAHSPARSPHGASAGGGGHADGEPGGGNDALNALLELCGSLLTLLPEAAEIVRQGGRAAELAK